MFFFVVVVAQEHPLLFDYTRRRALNSCLMMSWFIIRGVNKTLVIDDKPEGPEKSQ